MILAIVSVIMILLLSFILWLKPWIDDYGEIDD